MILVLPVSDMPFDLEKCWRQEFSLPHPSAPDQEQRLGLPVVSRTNLADENDAVAALISLPSLGRSNDESTPKHEPRALHIFPNYQFCHPVQGLQQFASLTCPPVSLCNQSSNSKPYGYEPTHRPYAENAHDPWFSGSTSLALPQDDDVLSPLHA